MFDMFLNKNEKLEDNANKNKEISKVQIIII